MELARKVGLPIPPTMVIEGKHPCYLIERYDRRRGEDGKLTHLHQEDFCQALGFSHGRKYEADGGPGFKACFGLTSDQSTQPALDKMIMLRWAIFNHLIGNCDAHAKNLSMLIAREDYQLSPLYDLLSTRVYGKLSQKFAMRIGGQHRSDGVLKEHWERLALAIGDNIRALRLQKNLTQHSLAAMAGVSMTALRHLESGEGASLGTLIRVVRALDRQEWLQGLAPRITINPLHMTPSRGVRRRARAKRAHGEEG